MLTHIKAINFKGIESIELAELGQLNVICGKNSSGKSTILEAINQEQYRSLGFVLESDSELLKSFFTNIQKKPTIDSIVAKSWFEILHSSLVEEKSVFYDKEIGSWVNFFTKKKNENHSLARHVNSVFDFHQCLTDYFVPQKKRFNSCLIPPKRSLRIKRDINLSENLMPNGDGVVNHLFYLKNQEIDSSKERLFRRIHSEFKKITGCSFNITPNNENKISVSFKDTYGEWRTSDKCGLGLSDLLIILTIVISTDFNFYLIEEPENHLHADFQRRLLIFFKAQEDKQFLLSSHSSTFIDHDRVDKIYYAWFDGIVNLSDQTSPSKIVSELGFSVSEKLTSDAIILVEGPTDIPILKHLFGLLGTTNNYNIKFWPLGGDIMSSLDLTIFNSNQNTYAIVDKDPGSSRDRKAFLKACNECNIESLQLKRYSVENYFSIEAIKKAFPGQFSKEIETIDHDRKVDEQLGFKAKNKSVKSRIPTILNHSNFEDFEGTDLFDFIKKIDRSLKDLGPMKDAKMSSQ